MITTQKAKVNILLVTYNRCPFPDFERNPLTWAIRTLMSNKNYNELVSEVLIVDDSSTDYTVENLKYLQKKYNFSYKYHKNNFRKGCSYSRKIGIEQLTNDLFILGDDDCLYKPDFLNGAVKAFLKIQQDHPNLAVLNLPVLERDVVFTGYAPKKEIGQTLFEENWFYHNFDKYPQEYVEHPEFLDDEKIFLKPFQVGIFKGVSINSKEAFIRSGNFLDLSEWGNDYSEHLEMAYRLEQNNYLIYHLPDEKVAAIHMKFGANSQDILRDELQNLKITPLNFTLGELVTISSAQRVNTGCRIDDYSFHIAEIGSFFSFYLKLSEDAGVKQAQKEYTNFVEKNLIFTTTTNKIIDKNVREEIWYKAIKKGLAITREQTHQQYSKAEKILL